jgi:hypothetical protein
MSKTPEYMRNYRRSESGKASIARYEAAKGAKRKERYLGTEKGKRTAALQRDRRRQRVRKITLEAKQKPCQDCHMKFDPICMDFHHVSGEKDFNIGWGRYGPKRVSAEIAKCIVLCANCHRLRHKK